jgi:hypothetical protein
MNVILIGMLCIFVYLCIPGKSFKEQSLFKRKLKTIR